MTAGTKESHAEVRSLMRAGCTCARVRRLARRVTQVYDRELADTGLRVTQFSLLSNLYANGPTPIGRLAAALDSDRTTLTRNLKPLVDAGYVVCRTGGEMGVDTRSRVAAITRDGERQLGRAGDAWLRAQREINALFGRDDVDALHRTVDDLLARLNAGRTSEREDTT